MIHFILNMRSSLSLLLVALMIIPSLASLTTVKATPNVPRQIAACDLNASGSDLGFQQDIAFRDYAHIFFEERDARRAFDKYIQR